MSLALEAARPRAAVGEETVRSEYLRALRMLERLHRLLLDVVKDEFDRRGGTEINSVQALLLYNMGERELTAGELKSRGHYLGSNVSYNLKKLVDMGYLHYKRSDTDRRSVRVSLTSKGQEARDVIQRLYSRQLGSVETEGKVTQEEFRGLNRAMPRLERFWTDQIRYGLLQLWVATLLARPDGCAFGCAVPCSAGCVASRLTGAARFSVAGGQRHARAATPAPQAW